MIVSGVRQVVAIHRQDAGFDEGAARYEPTGFASLDLVFSADVVYAGEYSYELCVELRILRRCFCELLPCDSPHLRSHTRP